MASSSLDGEDALRRPPAAYFLNFDASAVAKFRDAFRILEARSSNSSPQALADATNVMSALLPYRLVHHSGGVAHQNDSNFGYRTQENMMFLLMSKSDLLAATSRTLLLGPVFPPNLINDAPSGEARTRACLVTGTILRDCSVRAFTPFSDGWAGAVKPGGQATFVDRQGKLSFPHDYQAVGRFSEGFALAQPTSNKFGLVRPDGNYAIPPEYDFLHDVTAGWSHFQTAKESGLLSPQGKKISAPPGRITRLSPDALFVDSEGMSRLPTNQLRRILWTSGNVTILGDLHSPFAMPNGFAAIKSGELYHHWYDESGKRIHDEPIFERYTIKSSGAPMPLYRGDAWGLMGPSAKWIVPPKYGALGVFNYGFATVFLGQAGTPNRQAGFLHRSGKELWIPNMHDGFCQGHYFFVVHNDGSAAYYNRQGGKIEDLNLPHLR